MVTQTEHHFALKRFLLDNETVFDDVPENPEMQSPAPKEEEAQTLLTNLSLQRPSELGANSDRFPSPGKENPAPSHQYKPPASSRTLAHPPLQDLDEIDVASEKSFSQVDEQVVPYFRYVPPLQGPSEISAENNKNPLKGAKNIALYPQSTLSNTSETLNSPSVQELIDLGTNSGRSTLLEKMLRLAGQGLLETPGPQDKNASSQVCSSKGGCITPEIVAAVEDFEPSVKDMELSSLSFLDFYTFIGGDSQIPVPPIRSAHLYGFQAHCLTVPCPPGDTDFFEAVRDFRPRRFGDLSFKRGDIIRKDQQKYRHWAQGSLGKRTGLYSEDHVQPCSFRSLQSCILSSALRGQPLINEITTKHLFAASGGLDCTKLFVWLTLIVCF